jgi:predicted nucleic acid-binding protein
VSDFSLLRIYLDANVLFSAAYSDRNRFLDFWRMHAVIPISSPYAIFEARSHAHRPGHSERLETLLAKTQLVSDVDVRFIPSDIVLVEKDRPILSAAIGAGVDYLVTGDKNDFGHLCARSILGVKVILPTPFLNMTLDRLIL